MKHFKNWYYLLFLLVPVLFIKVVWPVVKLVLVIVLIGFAAVIYKAKKEGKSIDADFLKELVRRDTDKVLDAAYKEKEPSHDSESAGK